MLKKAVNSVSTCKHAFSLSAFLWVYRLSAHLHFAFRVLSDLGGWSGKKRSPFKPMEAGYMRGDGQNTKHHKPWNHNIKIGARTKRPLKPV